MIQLALISEGVNTWPVYVAQTLGFWRDHGVSVAFSVTGSSIKQLDALKKGEFDIGFQQVDHVVRGVEQGFDLFILMSQSHAPELSLVVSADIAAVLDLKGKTIIVDDANTGYSLLLKKLFAERGLKPTDTLFKNVGGSQERFDAMKNKEGSACFINPPFDRNLLAGGFKRLGTSGQFFPSYPGPVAAARRSWAQSHREELIGFIRGFNAAYAWLQNPQHGSEALALLPSHLQMDPVAAQRILEKVYGQPRPVIAPKAVEEVVNLLWWVENKTTPQAKAEKYMDLSFLRDA